MIGNLQIIFSVLFVWSSLQCGYVFSAQDKTGEAHLTTPQIIHKNGYPIETHYIQSQGYILEYHRIPHGKEETEATQPYPVLIHHGLLDSSYTWIANGPERGLAYLLADQGYDVWLANARGNTYSRNHLILKPNNKKFWDWTFHESGYYDVPAAIDFILNKTHAEKVIYIGHSMGTTTFYVFASTRPEYSDKVLVHISVAPVAAIPHTTSMYAKFVKEAHFIMKIANIVDHGGFMQYDGATNIFKNFFCKYDKLKVCDYLVMSKLLFGEDKEQFNTTLIPAILGHMPCGTSTKTIEHMAQLISPGKFRQYDYGHLKNWLHYGQKTPPAYDISKIKIPMKFYHAKNDIFSGVQDVKNFYEQLPKSVALPRTLIDNPKWTHVDFLWAKDVNKYFNNHLIEFLNDFTMQHNHDDIQHTFSAAGAANEASFGQPNVLFSGENLSGQFRPLNMHILQDTLHESVVTDDDNDSTNNDVFKSKLVDAVEKLTMVLDKSLEEIKNAAHHFIESLDHHNF